MRSKTKSRKVAQDETSLSSAGDQLDGHTDPQPETSTDGATNPLADLSDIHQVEVPHAAGPRDVPLPECLELRQSEVCGGAGVCSKVAIYTGQTLGPYGGAASEPSRVCSSRRSAELEDGRRKVVRWMSGDGDPDRLRWMRYMRSTTDPGRHNVVAVQISDQVYYKAVQNITPGEELLLSSRDGCHGDRRETSIGHLVSTDEEHKQFPCYKCGELFRSKVALRRHETYVCNNSNAIFSKLNQHLKEGPAVVRASVTSSSGTSATYPSTASQISDKRGSLPLKSKDQEMIQDVHRAAELLSPSQRAVHDLSHNNNRFDTINCRLDDGLGRLKQYPCENCEKVFNDSAELQRHIRSIHVGARSHTCSDCGKTFATSSGLKQHQHIHSSVKPFQCEVCLKAYTQFSNLCRHKRMHADCRQQIKCKDCGQTFSTMTSLGKHKRFCQGMLANGASRMGYPSPASSMSTEKNIAASIGSTNGTNMSAFTSPYGVPFYGHRTPFSFFPTVGAGFPMFPSGHPMAAAMMSASLAESKLHGLNHDKEDVESRRESRDKMDSDTEERNTKHRWASDHSNVSTTSDFAKSDIDSESDSERVFHTGLHEGQRPRKTSSPTMVSPSSRVSKNVVTSAFDLSRKTKKAESFSMSKMLSPSTPSDKMSTSGVSSSGEQPLDLSYKSLKEDTPRKTHIFGSEQKVKPKEKISPITKLKQHTPTNVSMSPKGKQPVESPERIHEAYPPTTASQMMMSRMYSHNLEKSNLEAYQEAARFMSMGPSRFPFPAMPAPFNPFSGALPGMFPHNPLDQAKVIGAPGFMRGPASAFPYAPGMNKMKDRYTCKFCGKIFPRSANLTRHLRTHTGEQPYKCKYCERSFSISSNLQRHIRNIHNKEKPFKCPICDRCFGQQTNLDRHLKKHEFEGPIVADSPLNEEHDCEDMTDIVPLNGDLGSTGSSGHASELSSPMKEEKDTSYTMPGSLQKLESSSLSNQEPKDLDDSMERSDGEADWDNIEEELEDLEEDDEDEEDEEEHDLPSAKRPKLLNNNLPSDDFSHCVVNLSNGSS